MLLLLIVKVYFTWSKPSGVAPTAADLKSFNCCSNRAILWSAWTKKRKRVLIIITNLTIFTMIYYKLLVMTDKQFWTGDILPIAVLCSVFCVCSSFTFSLSFRNSLTATSIVSTLGEPSTFLCIRSTRFSTISFSCVFLRNNLFESKMQFDEHCSTFWYH